MNTVQPIRDKRLIDDFADFLKYQNERNYVLFMCGIYLGRRISDILPLKVRDVRGRSHIYIREDKSKKEARVLINDDLKKILKNYTKDKKDYEYLFLSRQRRKGCSQKREITRQQAWKILNEAADKFEYRDPIGCHSLRKTFGYWLYEDTKDIVSLQELFNHSDISVTKRYIGITQDSKDNLVRSLSFRHK